MTDPTPLLEAEADEGLVDDSRNRGVAFEESAPEGKVKSYFHSGLFSLQPSTAVVLPACFLAILCNTGLNPVLPTYQVSWFTECDLDSPECEPNYEEAQKWAGIFDSIQNLCAFCVVPQLGRVSDVIGRKPIIIFSSIFLWLPLLSLWVTNAESPLAYFSTTVICGIFGSSKSTYIGIWNAYIADVTSESNRRLHFGYLGSITGLSMLMTPLLNKLDLALHSNASFLKILTLCGVVNSIYILLVVPESLEKNRRNSFRRRKLFPTEMFKLMKRSRILPWVSLIMLLGTTPEFGVAEIGLIYLNDEYSLKKDEAKSFNSKYFAYLGCTTLVTQLLVVRLLDWLRIRNSSTIVLSQIGNCSHMLVYASLHLLPIWAVYLNSIPTSLGFLANIGFNSLIADRMGKGEVNTLSIGLSTCITYFNMLHSSMGSQWVVSVLFLGFLAFLGL